jgi:hypothetical protein
MSGEIKKSEGHWFEIQEDFKAPTVRRFVLWRFYDVPGWFSRRLELGHF